MERSSKALRLLIFALFFCGCSKPVSKIAFEQQLENFRAVRTKGTSPEWILEAGKLLKKNGNFVISPKLTICENGKPSAHIIAATGFFDDDFREARIAGNVEITLKDKSKIFLEDINWDGEKKIFFTDNPVRQVTPASVITGDGLVADENLTRVEVKNPVVTAKIGS
ncbi:MAG: LPS export ABC transporter periplasmic protein LptC [Elusimicrobia bacterium]|nr:LPS export ABC transporter periplasmic protein LptC [Elusimicrobiota bacterium]